MTFRQRIISYSPYAIAVLVAIAALVPLSVDAQQGLGDSAISGIKSLLYFIVVGFFGWLMGIAGWLLDYSVNTFIVDFGTTFGTQGVGKAVDALWVTVRDFFNIIFIFGLVYIGFKMILDSDDSRTKNTLVTLVIAALLVNFSLFITKFVVDFTNILATEVATAGFQAADGAVDSNEIDIANTFFDLMQVARTLDIDAELANGEAGGGTWAFIFGNAIIYLIGTFVFASGAIMILIRFVALSIYMVLSPFMFIGWVLPGFSNVTRKYWSGFLGRAFFAPVYVILIYFSAVVLQNTLGRGTGSSQNGGVVSNTNHTSEQFAEILAPFLLTSAFMVAAVVVANKLSADGSGAVMKVGGNMVRGGRRRLQNGAVWTGRKIERGGTALPRYGARSAANYGGNKLNQYIDKKQRAGSKLANNWWVDEKVRGTASSLKSTKAGFDNTIDERDKKQSKLDTRQEAWADIDAGRKAADKKYDTPDPTSIYNPATETIMAKSALSAIDLDAAEKAAEKRELAKATMIGRLRDLNPQELEDLLQNDEKAFDEVIAFLDDSKTQKLLESENLNTTQIKAVYNKRAQALKDSVIKQGVSVASEFNKLTIKQIELLGDQFIRDNAEMFSQDQWDAIKKSDKFTETQKESYKGARKKRVKEVLTTSGSNPEVGGLIYESVGAVKTASGKWNKAIDPKKFKKPKEIAALPYDALVDTRLIGSLPVDAIKQIGRDNAGGKSSLSVEEVKKLYDELFTKKKGSAEVQKYLGTTRAQRDFLDKV